MLYHLVRPSASAEVGEWSQGMSAIDSTGFGARTNRSAYVVCSDGCDTNLGST